MWNLFDQVQPRIASVTFVLSAAGLAILAVLGAADAFSDAVLSQPIILTQELSQVMLATVFFLALATTQQKREHISVDVVVSLFPAWLRDTCARFGILLGAIVLGIIAYRLWLYAFASLSIFETATARVRFPIYPFKLICAFGATSATLECIRQLLMPVARLRQEIDANEGGVHP